MQSKKGHFIFKTVEKCGYLLPVHAWSLRAICAEGTNCVKLTRQKSRMCCFTPRLKRIYIEVTKL